MVIAYALESFDTDKVTVVGEVTRYIVLALFTVMFLASVGTINRGGSLYSLWYSLTYIQFVRCIPIVDLQQSDVFNSFYKEIYKMYDIYTFFPVSENTVLSQTRFSLLGFEGSIFINNAEEMLWAWGACLLILLIIMLLGLMSNSKVIADIMGMARFSLIIRVSLIVFFDLILSAVLQLYYIDFQGTIPFTSSLMALIFVTLGSLFAVYIPVIIKLKLNMTKEMTPEQALGTIMTLVGEFYGKMEIMQYMFYPLTLYIRSSAAIILVLLWKYPVIQVAILGINQILMIGYIYGYNPFKYHLDNVFVFITEIIILLIVLTPCLYQISDGDFQVYLDMVCICFFWTGLVMCLCRYICGAILNGSWNELHTIVNAKSSSSEPTIDMSIDCKDNYNDSKGKKISPEKDADIKAQRPNEPYENLYRDTSEQELQYEKNVEYLRESNGASWKVIELKDPKELRNTRNPSNASPALSNSNSRRNSTYGEGIPFYPRIAAKYIKRSNDA